MKSEITLRGDKELIRKLNKLQPKKQEASMKAMGLHLVSKMQVYPPQSFAGSGSGAGMYIRTRNLAKRWDAKAKTKEVQVFNTATYSPYVQGDQNQFHFHRATGWQTLKATALKNSDQMVALLKKNIDRILEHG